MTQEEAIAALADLYSRSGDLLSSEARTIIKRDLSVALDREEAEARRVLEDVRRRRAAFLEPVKAPAAVVTNGHAGQRKAVSGDMASWPAYQLVLHFASEHPGSEAGEFVRYVSGIRGPDFDSKNVYSALYKATKKGKLTKSGSHGASAYTLTEANRGRR